MPKHLQPQAPTARMQAEILSSIPRDLLQEYSVKSSAPCPPYYVEILRPLLQGFSAYCFRISLISFTEPAAVTEN
ncbi:hypothetical protein MA16_Dca016899 [Dendrobium catenatum]|uniref:Uncharacterized protein n=1 Tax=Dendrobium catenatum TaxID=906689 RepID=A0A2I0W4W3_9ASPA|nr:hypothetical protein MA16_Dca016899 [Dendrobium catenatum]